jgi:hypothetical protein
LRVRPKDVARGLSWISNPDCAIAQVSAAADLSSSLRGRRVARMRPR